MSHADRFRQIIVCWFQTDTLNNLWIDWLVDFNALIRKIQDGAGRYSAKPFDFVKTADYFGKNWVGSSKLRLISQWKEDLTSR